MSNQKNKSKRKVYPASYELKLVKLHEEEGYSYQYLCEQTGVGHRTLTRWVGLYRKEGPIMQKSVISVHFDDEANERPRGHKTRTEMIDDPTWKSISGGL